MSSFLRYTAPPRPSAPTAGPEGYVPDDRTVAAVNTALALGRTLLVTGEPGVGKTTLAEAVAWRLGLPAPLGFVVRSDSRGRDLCYTFDHLLRMYDAVAHVGVGDLSKYLSLGPIGVALAPPGRRVVLIDEIDKAPRDFPNDLLEVLDRWRYRVDETRETVGPVEGAERPIVFVTSNEERGLPEPFLRRCVYLHLGLPKEPEARKRKLLDIVERRVGPAAPAEAAAERFLAERDRVEWKKRPSTSELLEWIQALRAEGRVTPDDVRRKPLGELLPYALVKTRDDLRTLGIGD